MVCIPRQETERSVQVVQVRSLSQVSLGELDVAAAAALVGVALDAVAVVTGRRTLRTVSDPGGEVRDDVGVVWGKGVIAMCRRGWPVEGTRCRRRASATDCGTVLTDRVAASRADQAQMRVVVATAPILQGSQASGADYEQATNEPVKCAADGPVIAQLAAGSAEVRHAALRPCYYYAGHLSLQDDRVYRVQAARERARMAALEVRPTQKQE